MYSFAEHYPSHIVNVPCHKFCFYLSSLCAHTNSNTKTEISKFNKLSYPPNGLLSYSILRQMLAISLIFSPLFMLLHCIVSVCVCAMCTLFLAWILFTYRNHVWSSLGALYEVWAHGAFSISFIKHLTYVNCENYNSWTLKPFTWRSHLNYIECVNAYAGLCLEAALAAFRSIGGADAFHSI